MSFAALARSYVLSPHISNTSAPPSRTTAPAVASTGLVRSRWVATVAGGGTAAGVAPAAGATTGASFTTTSTLASPVSFATVTVSDHTGLSPTFAVNVYVPPSIGSGW